MESTNTITINTDASFYERESIGGYAFWIVCDLFKVQKGGYFRDRVKDSSEAELKCIGNALATLLADKRLPLTTHIVLNTDSKWSILQINNPRCPLGKSVSEMWGRLIKNTDCKKHSIRHVKAHSGINDKRSYVNEWCDKEAKKWARISLTNHYNKKK